MSSDFIKRFLLHLFYLSCWLCFFVFTRIVFILWNYQWLKPFTFIDIGKTFYHGFKLDISTSSYISFFPFLLISFLMPNKKLWNELLITLLKIYTFFCLIYCSLLICSDLNIYNSWNTRIDATVVNYLSHPSEIIHFISWDRLGVTGFFFLVLFMIFSIIINRFSINKISKINTLNFPNKFYLFPTILFSLVITVLLILPARGGLQVAPINQSSAYFSKHHHLNQTAINPVWNFHQSLINLFYAGQNDLNQLMSEEKAKSNLKKLYSDTLPAPDTLLSPLCKTSTNLKPNILLIILESWSMQLIAELGGEKDLTPSFSKLCKEGLLYKNFYANGDRTDKGLVSILSGFPAMSKFTIMNEPAKASKLPMLSRELHKQGYINSFYYGGEIEFVNLKSYLLNGNFDNIISKTDFSKSEYNSKWGVHDHILFQRVADEIKNTENPFFSCILTLSSHEPFEIPVNGRLHAISDEDLFRNSVYYTDSCLGDFMLKASREEWYKNTLLVITADHGHILPWRLNHYENRKNNIPLLITGGILNEYYKNKTISYICSQIDIAYSILEILEIDNKKFTWGKNIFFPTVNGFAYYTFNNGFGWIRDKGTLIFDFGSRTFLQKDEGLDKNEFELAASLVQLSYIQYKNY